MLVYIDSVLTEHPAYIERQNEYRWTSRTIRSAKNPNLVAQVWRHVSLPEEGTAPAEAVSPVPTAAEDPHAMASDATTQEMATEPEVATSTVGKGHVEGWVAARSQDGETPTVEDATGLLDGEQLFLLRRRAKLTVKEVSEATGLATSKISAIEKGTGKRIKSAEVRALQDYLSPDGPEIATGSAEQLAQIQYVDSGDVDAPRD
jgi:hypothetical protein